MSPTDRRRDVLDSLGRAIVTGEMTPGQSLTLEAIQSRYGVSRTLARDCVHALESVGIIASRRRVGITVQPREHWSALAPQLVRWQLEADPHGPTLGALTEQRSGLLALAATIRAKGTTGNVASYLDDDIAFHRLILEASHNDTFKALTDVVAEVLSGRARLTGQVQVPQPEALKLHERVASAIATGDATAAESSMRDLVAEVRSALLERGLRGFLEA